LTDDGSKRADDAPQGADIALIHGKTADGEGLRIIRQREDRLELGAVRPLKQGAPIVGEVVSLTPRPEFPLLCDVKVELEAPAAAKARAESRHGPAQVATAAYRENWERIWPSKREPELAN
jgi:hypothetical protein